MLSMGHWTRVIELDKVFKASPRPGLLVDAGCGDCQYSLRIKADKRIGVDLNPPHKDGIETIKGDVSNIPLKDATADCVICLDVIEHVQDDNKVIAEFRRILRDKGTLILTTPTESEFMPVKILRKIFRMNTALLHKEWRHLRVYSETSLITLLEKNGFRVIISKDIYQPLTRFLEPANWYSGMLRLFNIREKSSMDKDYTPGKAGITYYAGKIYDGIFRLTIAHLVKLTELTGGDGFTHFMVCERAADEQV